VELFTLNPPDGMLCVRGRNREKAKERNLIILPKKMKLSHPVKWHLDKENLTCLDFVEC